MSISAIGSNSVISDIQRLRRDGAHAAGRPPATGPAAGFQSMLGGAAPGAPDGAGRIVTSPTPIADPTAPTAPGVIASPPSQTPRPINLPAPQPIDIAVSL